ncbi:MAG TPA: AI-2E family transporter [Candidatus Limnocylindria bacterium]|jgi:predicted PurR-regulated permease PerM|nr:AI-2E family transporter [Candidatus Limnocylindria bacterium]
MVTGGGPALGLRPRERRWLLIFLILGAAYFAVLLLQLALSFLAGFSQLILILFLAWLLAFVMSPVVRALEDGLHLHRAIAVVIAYTLALIGLGFAIFWVGGAITVEVTRIGQEFPQTAVRIEDTLGGYQNALGLERFGGPNLVELFRTAQTQVGDLAGAIFDQAEVIAGATLATLGSLVLILILSLYMLMDSERIWAKVNRAVPKQYSDELNILERSVARAFGGFLRAQIILAAIQAVLVTVVGVIFGIPYLFLVGTLSTLAMLIPFFGPPLALVPPIVAAWIYTPAGFLPVVIILVALQTVIVNWLQPRLMQGALGMHPILVLVGLLVGAQVAGVWGALFGIPVIAVLNVFLNLVVWSELPNAALPKDERLEDVPEATMVRVEREQISDETHPHIHVHKSLRPDGTEEVGMVVDDGPETA